MRLGGTFKHARLDYLPVTGPHRPNAYDLTSHTCQLRVKVDCKQYNVEVVRWRLWPKCPIGPSICGQFQISFSNRATCSSASAASNLHARKRFTLFGRPL